MICSPDKDMAQCVRDDRSAARSTPWITYDEDGAVAKWESSSVHPRPAGTVGDAADGYRGRPAGPRVGRGGGPTVRLTRRHPGQGLRLGRAGPARRRSATLRERRDEVFLRRWPACGRRPLAESVDDSAGTGHHRPRWEAFTTRSAWPLRSRPHRWLAELTVCRRVRRAPVAERWAAAPRPRRRPVPRARSNHGPPDMSETVAPARAASGPLRPSQADTGHMSSEGLQIGPPTAMPAERRRPSRRSPGSRRGSPRAARQARPSMVATTVGHGSFVLAAIGRPFRSRPRWRSRAFRREPGRGHADRRNPIDDQANRHAEDGNPVVRSAFRRAVDDPHPVAIPVAIRIPRPGRVIGSRPGAPRGSAPRLVVDPVTTSLGLC